MEALAGRGGGARRHPARMPPPRRSAAHGPSVRFAHAGAPAVLMDGALRRLSVAHAGRHAPVPFAGAFVLNLACFEAAAGPTVRLSRSALEGILGGAGPGSPAQRVCLVIEGQRVSSGSPDVRCAWPVAEGRHSRFSQAPGSPC